MGFLAGFLVAIPVGIYFGERNIPFPITYYRRPNAWGYIEMDLRFMETVSRDFNQLIGRNANKKDE